MRCPKAPLNKGYCSLGGGLLYLAFAAERHFYVLHGPDTLTSPSVYSYSAERLFSALFLAIIAFSNRPVRPHLLATLEHGIRTFHLMQGVFQGFCLSMSAVSLES